MLDNLRIQVLRCSSTKPPPINGKTQEMNGVTSTLIDLAEAAYVLDAQDSDWLHRVVAASSPLLDRGMGVVGGFYSLPCDGIEAALQQLHVRGASEHCAIRLARLAAEIAPSSARPYACMTLSEAMGEPAELARCGAEHRDCAEDALGLWVRDSDGRGAFILAPLVQRTVLSSQVRRRWQVAGAHLATGFRVRRALKKGSEGVLSKVERGSSMCAAVQALRRAAVLADWTREPAREAETDAPMQLWKNLLHGDCSMLDCFDAGSRRYILSTCRRPGVKDPHGLTKRERDVTALAVCGESGKLIGHQLGLSTPRVSELLHDVMRKLRVHTQAELVAKMRRLGLN